MNNRPSWDNYFLKICDAVCERSLDENTKLGCVIVNSNHRIVSTGYNSLPAGLSDNQWPMSRETSIPVVKHKINGELWVLMEHDPDDPELLKEWDIVDKVTKYDVVVHAEANAICSAAALGVSTQGCILYCGYLPCAECAKLVISAGIKEIVYVKENPRFGKSHAIAREMFKQSGVKVRWIEQI